MLTRLRMFEPTPLRGSNSIRSYSQTRSAPMERRIHVRIGTSVTAAARRLVTRSGHHAVSRSGRMTKISTPRITMVMRNAASCPFQV